MKFSHGLKWFLILLIPLALLTRLAVVPDDLTELRAALVVFLEKNRFAVSALDRNIGGMPVLEAISGSCRMRVMKTADQAWNQHPVKSLATPSDSVFFIVRGQVRTEFSTWLAMANASWSRLLRRLGLDAYPSHTLAVVGPDVCHAERLPWADLR